MPAFPVRKVIDPTGAGDTFAGAFLGYLAKNGWKDRTHWKRALVQASVIASFVVEDFSLNRVRDLSKEEENGREERFMKMISLA